MDCLKNFIQIFGCGAPEYSYDANTDQDDDPETDPTPASGLYINKDLPVSLKQMDAIADQEQVTFLGVWDEVQDRAIRKFVILVKAGYKELFGLCEGIDDDWICENREALALTLLYICGSELMFERLYSDRINRYTTIDREKAKELRVEFEAEFQNQLKNALELINAGEDQESDDIFSFVESLP